MGKLGLGRRRRRGAPDGLLPPIELIPLTLTGVTYRQTAEPQCTVVVESIYIIDP